MTFGPAPAVRSRSCSKRRAIRAGGQSAEGAEGDAESPRLRGDVLLVLLEGRARDARRAARRRSQHRLRVRRSSRAWPAPERAGDPVARPPRRGPRLQLRRPCRADVGVRRGARRARRRRRESRVHLARARPRAVHRRAGCAQARQRRVPVVLRVRSRAHPPTDVDRRGRGAGHDARALPPEGPADSRLAHLTSPRAARRPRTSEAFDGHLRASTR